MITVSDASGSSRVTGEHLSRLEDLTAFLFDSLHLDRSVRLDVTLIDDDAMERLHLDWMDLSGTTDVMSFPMDELAPGTAERPVDGGVLGDVVISPEVAARQADAAGHGLDDELALLAVHGVLHLLGHDHATPEERAEMFALQTALLEEFLGRPAPRPTEAGAPPEAGPAGAPTDSEGGARR
ncbi:rRNA maturation RNase YbeY [Nesterenkonia marinintestina]|uniref:rRNA maturation RNase YbeY n=1 Tax=Nesterenkonia marinintestina TaxID=2979865 RepID=UPI0021BE37D4|nr:rRNA maturation RNase YbeY [Nesterenkonia sp. GX14115]